MRTKIQKLLIFSTKKYNHLLFILLGIFFYFLDHCGPPPIMASSIGRNSPLLELAGVSSNRSSSLGRNTSLIPMTSEAAHMRPKGAPPLLDDDRESCV